MRKQILLLNIRNYFFLSIIVVFIIMLLSVLIVGTGSKKQKYNIPKFAIKPNDIIFDKSNGGGPDVSVYITEEKKIVKMSLEEYVRGVVCGEMPAEFSMEAIKAQAVAARTFTLAHMESYGGHKYNGAKGADVDDTVECQVYMNKEKRLSDWPESKKGIYWNKITDAVKETSGEILTYKGQVLEAPYFFSTSGGKTENCSEVFSFDEPYLKSVTSPGDNQSPRYKTILNISNSEFVKKVNDADAKAQLNVNNLKKQVNIKERSNFGGTVKKIQLGNIDMKGTDFRWLLGLYSYNFDINISDKTTTITSHGYGHDVGMSQWGANAMAKDGKKYKEILKHYYQGVNIEKLNWAKSSE